MVEIWSIISLDITLSSLVFDSWQHMEPWNSFIDYVSLHEFVQSC